MRPSIYVTAERTQGARSVDELREYVREGSGKHIWDQLLARCRGDKTEPPYTLRTPFAERPAGMVEQAAHDWYTYNRTTQRVVYGALAHLVTEDPAYKNDALRQLESLMDDTQWPDWRHGVNARRGVVADHRVGGYVHYVSLAYDWLHAFLTPPQREWIREGLVRKGIDRIFKSRAKDAHWGNYNNWTGAITAGAGFAGMCLREEFPRSQELIDFSVPWMHTYLETLGPEGEFNESPAYAASVTTALRYFTAYRSYLRGTKDVLGATRLREFGRWYAYHILPPARIVPFGDSERTSPPSPLQLGALAGLAGDPVLQWFYHRFRDVVRYDDHPFELLAVDPSLEPTDPEGVWPHGRAYAGYGQDVISRTSWDPVAPACVVYGKGSHGWEDARERGDTASYHLDYDAGQVCIEGFGQRFIVDLYNSGGYGPTDKGLRRQDYYGKGTFGHNVPMIGGRNSRELGDPRPSLTASQFDDQRGGWWRVDLTGAYEGARRVARTVVHLYPGIVVVLDEADLEKPEEVSLRWHTEEACEPDDGGRFTVRSGEASCVARVVALTGDEIRCSREEHTYEPPYDVNYHNIEYEQHESYVEAIFTGLKAVFLSLFCVAGDDGVDRSWETRNDGWVIDLPAGEPAAAEAAVRVSADAVHVSNAYTGGAWTVGRMG